tara:strand:- start:213 stop:536 length:324 start_codon:yes stop_codon:yes gene_type:complete
MQEFAKMCGLSFGALLAVFAVAGPLEYLAAKNSSPVDADLGERIERSGPLHTSAGEKIDPDRSKLDQTIISCLDANPDSSTSLDVECLDRLMEKEAHTRSPQKMAMD